MENNLVINKQISLLLWGIGFSLCVVALLLLFSWKWTIVALLWVSLISPLVSVFLYSFFKPFIDRRIFHLRDFISGAIEALALLVIGKLNPSSSFLLAVAALYIVNQISRSIRDGSLDLTNEEFRELLGFIGMLPVVFLLTTIV